MHADCGYRYWRQTPEGRLVVGGWRNLDLAAEETADEALNTRIQAELAKFLALVAGSAAEIEHRWAGIMGFTPDSFPIVGAMPDTPRLLVAAGYSGHGVAMAFECGARVARLALGGEAHLPEAFRPERFL
jgi:glycine/D-amino acid oxidase-like deaminating enzyme